MPAAEPIGRRRFLTWSGQGLRGFYIRGKAVDCEIVSNDHSDATTMKFAGGLALFSRRNQPTK